MYRVLEPGIVVGPWGATTTRAAFEALLVYSSTLPTGTRIGKVWRRYVCTEHETCGVRYTPNPSTCRGYWLLGEYHDIGEAARVGLRWHQLLVCADVALEAHLSLARWWSA